jgi:hypothetical protein
MGIQVKPWLGCYREKKINLREVAELKGDMLGSRYFGVSRVTDHSTLSLSGRA